VHYFLQDAKLQKTVRRFFACQITSTQEKPDKKHICNIFLAIANKVGKIKFQQHQQPYMTPS
jgi:hypothetical protein